MVLFNIGQSRLASVCLLFCSDRMAGPAKASYVVIGVGSPINQSHNMIYFRSRADHTFFPAIAAIRLSQQPPLPLLLSSSPPHSAGRIATLHMTLCLIFNELTALRVSKQPSLQITAQVTNCASNFRINRPPSFGPPTLERMLAKSY